MVISLQDLKSKGKAFAQLNDIIIAEMTYSKAGTKQIIINHTEVDNSMKGRGIGRQLLDVIVEYARENQKMIIPLCPFARSEFDKDASIGDVLRPLRWK